MCRTGDQGPAPDSAAEALAFVRTGLSFLASADPRVLTCAEQAELLRELGSAEAMQVAAISRALAAFDAVGGHELDGQGTARSWLRWQNRITSAAAGAATAWMRRLQAHPAVAAALAAGTVSPSWAREICDWTDKLPGASRHDGDEILLGAAASGAELADLSALAEEMVSRASPPDGDDGDESFAKRRLRLTTHFRGWAKLDGDLAPAAAEALQAVLDALGKKVGPEDERTKPQRDHDALAEACRRLIAAGTLPQRGGQPTRMELHMTLDQLLKLPGADAAAAAWAGSGAPAPPGADCDATIVPVITGHVDQDVLAELAARLVPGAATTGVAATDSTALAARAAGQLAIRDAVRLLSGPGGLASYLRTGLLSGPAASISLPLDVGDATETVPAHLRRAIVARDKHCRFAGCLTPASACHVHHIIPRSEGGATSLENCILGCDFHHLVAIHLWGWKLTLNHDGTTTAISPDGKRVVHSHAPPTAA